MTENVQRLLNNAHDHMQSASGLLTVFYDRYFDNREGGFAALSEDVKARPDVLGNFLCTVLRLLNTAEKNLGAALSEVDA